MAAVPPLLAGLGCRCPRRGGGALHQGRPGPRAHYPGGGPVVFVVPLPGTLVFAAALVVEAEFSPPLWIHAVPWPIFILGGAIAMLRFFKASPIALQFRHRDP